MAKKTLYLNLEELERRLFLSKLEQAIRESDDAYYFAGQIIQQADMKNIYDKTKWFNKNIHQ